MRIHVGQHLLARSISTHPISHVRLYAILISIRELIFSFSFFRLDRPHVGFVEDPGAASQALSGSTIPQRPSKLPQIAPTGTASATPQPLSPQSQTHARTDQFCAQSAHLVVGIFGPTVYKAICYRFIHRRRSQMR